MGPAHEQKLSDFFDRQDWLLPMIFGASTERQSMLGVCLGEPLPDSL